MLLLVVVVVVVTRDRSWLFLEIALSILLVPLSDLDSGVSFLFLIYQSIRTLIFCCGKFLLEYI